MSEWLADLWSSLDNPTIWKEFPEGIALSIFDEAGIYDNTPLFNFLTKIAHERPAYKRNLFVSAVDVNTGNYVVFDDVHTDLNYMPASVTASASIPFVFPPRKIDKYVLMDGGTAWGTNLVSAVDKCRSKVSSDSQIILDIVLCYNSKINAKSDTGNSISNFIRYMDIHNYYSHMNNIVEFKRSRPNIQYRYLIVPSGPVTSGFDELQFT